MNEIVISSSKLKMDIDFIHAYLNKAYWSEGRTLEQVKLSIDHSICFGLYANQEQVGFARVVTDHVVFAYIMDVFILNEYQGHGYGKDLMNTILSSSKLSRVEQWYLKTKDAHSFYEQTGFRTINDAEMWMLKLMK